jgi:hypothetical protein
LFPRAFDSEGGKVVNTGTVTDDCDHGSVNDDFFNAKLIKEKRQKLETHRDIVGSQKSVLRKDRVVCHGELF